LPFFEQRGDVDMLELSLSFGGNINLQSKDKEKLGMYPIHWGAECGNLTSVSFLLDVLPEVVNLRDGRGYSPLTTACQHGKDKVAALLVWRGADIELLDNEGDNCFMWSAHNSHLTTLGLTKNLGAKVGEKDSFGQTAFHLAAMKGKVEIIQFLMENNGNGGLGVVEEDSKGKSALVIARERGHILAELFMRGEGKKAKAFKSISLNRMRANPKVIIIFILHLICFLKRFNSLLLSPFFLLFAMFSCSFFGFVDSQMNSREFGLFALSFSLSYVPSFISPFL